MSEQSRPRPRDRYGRFERITMLGFTGPIEWPSREEWAKQQRTLYWDELLSEHPVSEQLSDYATRDETAAAAAALRAVWLAKGRAMKTARARAGWRVRQPGEPKKAYIARWCSMPEDDREIVREYDDLQDARRELNKAIADLRADMLRPWRWHVAYPPPLKEIVERYEQARREARDALIAERAQAPIDDAAWAEELEMRQRLTPNAD
jgi:hypothetical protein